MRKIPVSVIIISALYITAGLVGIGYHATELWESPGFETYGVLFLRLLAIIGGIFALRGANWARYLLLVWIVYHIRVSIDHAWSEVLAHCVIFALTVVALFNPKARAFFKKP